MGSTHTECPSSIDYRNSTDLEKATGVEFPEVIPVDSVFFQEWMHGCTSVTFVPKRALTKEFFERLDKACETESSDWCKDERGYHYYNFQHYNFQPRCSVDSVDVTNGTRHGTAESGDTTLNDGGEYVAVSVPLEGDTITVEYGWYDN